MKIIDEIRRDKRLYGTCPSCGENFQLAKATLFNVADELPERATNFLKICNDQLKKDRQDLKARRHRITNRSRVTAESVNLGKIVEKIAPSFATFSYAASDCRALFEPVDYLVFSGLSRTGSVDALRFIDVKSGKARLSPAQREIRASVQSGNVRFSTVKKSGAGK